ncbi:uncharacterized protein [Branchiostoma lanceolatum]|uniref:uncharacterized protein n=1 Tax=Branchiostoma lanceolatum TaxID=7740 RepID=UPI00345489D7
MDEKMTTGGQVACTEYNTVTCGDGSCFPADYRCDGNDDCSDGADELGCPTFAPACALFCDNNTQCIPGKWVCDYWADCDDLVDEQNCDCTDTFTCYNGICVLPEYRCDGRDQCGDGSDERYCESTLPSIPSSSSPSTAALTTGKVDLSTSEPSASTEVDSTTKALSSSPSTAALAASSSATTILMTTTRETVTTSEAATTPPLPTTGKVDLSTSEPFASTEGDSTTKAPSSSPSTAAPASGSSASTISMTTTRETVTTSEAATTPPLPTTGRADLSTSEPSASTEGYTTTEIVQISTESDTTDAATRTVHMTTGNEVVSTSKLPGSTKAPMTVVEMAVTLVSETFTADLQDSSTEAFQTLSAQIIATINPVYQNYPGFAGAVVRGFRSGSVIADVNVLIDNKEEADDGEMPLAVASVLQSAATNGDGMVGGLEVRGVAYRMDGVTMDVVVCSASCHDDMTCVSSGGECRSFCTLNTEYCLNGGTCEDRTPTLECNCPSDTVALYQYSGKRCQNGEFSVFFIAMLAAACALVFIVAVGLVVRCWPRGKSMSMNLNAVPVENQGVYNVAASFRENGKV